MCSKSLLNARRQLVAGLDQHRWISPGVFLSMSACAGSSLREALPVSYALAARVLRAASDLNGLWL